VYWDDPNHMQAAPDRSVDEPDLTSAKSSLRASIKSASPVIKGSLSPSVCLSPCVCLSVCHLVDNPISVQLLSISVCSKRE